MNYNPNPMTTSAIGTAVDVSSSPVRDRISQAEQIMSESHAALDALEQRLDTILTPVPPSPANAASAQPASQPKSHVAGRLELLNEGYSHLIYRLNALRGRIEL